jgi:arginase family enzyme
MNGTVSSEQRAVRLIGVASGLGVPVRMRAGSQRAAVALEAEDVGAGMRRNRIDCAWDELIAPGDPSLPRDEALRRLCRELEERVAACIGSAALPVVLGGDHAMAVGTWRGTVRALGGRPGLLWIDAHLDAHTSRDSPSGNPHGMPLAALFGCGPNPWDNDEGVLDASRCCVFGVRSYEESEWRRMDELGVRIVTMDDIRRRGLPAALGAALAHVGGGAFGISIDLDAIDRPLRRRQTPAPTASTRRHWSTPRSLTNDRNTPPSRSPNTTRTATPMAGPRGSSPTCWSR